MKLNIFLKTKLLSLFSMVVLVSFITNKTFAQCTPAATTITGGTGNSAATGTGSITNGASETVNFTVAFGSSASFLSSTGQTTACGFSYPATIAYTGNQGGSGATITYTFDKPLTSVILFDYFNSNQNSSAGETVFYTTNAGVLPVMSINNQGSCNGIFSVSGNKVIGTNAVGNVQVKLTSTSPFTSITISEPDADGSASNQGFQNGGTGAALCSTGATLAPCTAGTTQVSLSSTTLNACSPSTVNLNTTFTGTTPGVSGLVWFTNTAHTGTAYATPTAATAGTYYAFFYDSAANCYNTANSTSSVVANTSTSPTPGAITGPICILPPISGQVYSVPAVPGETTYTWAYSGSFGRTGVGMITSGAGTNSITVSFADAPTSGTLSVTVTTSCGVSSASTLDITVLPKPSIATVGNSTICPGGGSIILNSTPAPSYQWYKDSVLISGATSQNYTATATGAYTVITSGPGSCASVESAAFNVLSQDITPPLFVSPLGVTTKNVKIDFRNAIAQNLPQIYNNIETGALANERVRISQSTAGAVVQGTTSIFYPSTADGTGPAAYGNNKLLFLSNSGADPIRTVAFNFDHSVSNLQFSLFDIDGVSKLEARAYNNGVLQPITLTSLKTAGPTNTTASASPSTTPTITGVNAAYTIGTLAQMRIAGINVSVPNPVNSFILASITTFNSDPDFYISQISYDYTSPVLPADITVNCNAIPVPIVLTATDNCSSAAVVYTQTPAVYTPSTTPTNLVRTWTATDTSGNINTFTQTITVNPIATPTVAASNQNICATNYSALANITITGTNIKWYTDATTTTALPLTTLLVNGTTYYASQTIIGNCESSRIPVTVNLKNCSWINPSLRSKASK